MEASNVRRLKEMEHENRYLKQMFADLSVKHGTMRGIVEKSSDTSRETGDGLLRQRPA
jgi:hypothetical protein